MLCAFGVAVALSLPAAAGAAPVATVKVAKQHGGPFADDDIPANVTKPRDLYMKAINEISSPEEFVLTDESGGIGEPDYHVGWFKGSKNISPDVANPDPFCLAGHFYDTTHSFSLYGLIAINAASACV